MSKISSDLKVVSCRAAELSSGCNQRLSPALVFDEENCLAVACKANVVIVTGDVRIEEPDRLARAKCQHDELHGVIRRRFHQTGERQEFAVQKVETAAPVGDFRNRLRVAALDGQLHD